MSPLRKTALPVLVAAPDLFTVRSLTAALRLRGFDARYTTTGRDALVLAAAWPPSAAVIHLRLPPADGYAVARLLREALPRHPLLVAAADSGTGGERARARAFGFAHYLVKPLDPEELVNLLRTSADGGRRSVWRSSGHVSPKTPGRVGSAQKWGRWHQPPARGSC
jgi:DNA-binding response OmpR family regulator